MDYIVMGENIRTFRKERMLTQETLAELCDVSTVFICQIENGTRKPSLDTVYRLSQVLGVTVDEIINPEAVRRDLRDFSHLLAGRTDSELTIAYSLLKTLFENMEKGKN